MATTITHGTESDCWPDTLQVSSRYHGKGNTDFEFPRHERHLNLTDDHFASLYNFYGRK
jgi:hypothetical protein